jgi:signal transduction histidine kinase
MSKDKRSNKLREQWDEVKPCVESADIAFVCLRIIIICGGIGWLIFSHISQKTFGDVSNLFVFFVIYSVFIYLWLFFYPEKKRIIHVFILFFDFLFTLLLVRVTGGFYSHFLIGFYLMTALYSFYYGLMRGIVIAAIASALYLLSGDFNFTEYYWADFSVSIASLFLLAVPIGMLSQTLKKDKLAISGLNKDLEIYIEELQKVHGRLIQVEKMSELGRMTADVAHEIRNPLTSIGGFARRLEKNLLHITSAEACMRIISKEKEYAEIIISEVTRLEKILRDVLTFSREPKYRTEYQEVNGVIKESLKTFEDICAEQSIRIEVIKDETIQAVFIDRDQVKQAIINLISNAIDVMPDGGKLKICTSMEELNNVNYVSVEVADTGCGMPEEELTTIFEPFYSSKEIGVGTGLGLSICKKIMDEHNGLIRVESELGKGSSFKLLFPYQSKEEGMKTQCWEFNMCGAEKTEGDIVNVCHAYPHYGRICWAVAGTFCGKKVGGIIARKLGDCKECTFYKRVVESKDH